MISASSTHSLPFDLSAVIARKRSHMSNLLHLLQLNPEFLLSYLYLRASSESPQPKINVWHLIWMVHQASDRGSAVSTADAQATQTSWSGMHLQLRVPWPHLFFAPFFKLRQYDVLFHSYLSASLSAESLSPSLRITPFSIVAGAEGEAGFDLPSMMRNIPPLKSTQPLGLVSQANGGSLCRTHRR